MRTKLHEVVSLRYQFWGPGPKGYTPIMTTLPTKDVVLRCSLIIDSALNFDGLFAGYSCLFFWEGTDRPGETYREDYDYPISRAREAAENAIQYARAGHISIDPFFEELRQGAMESDKDFAKVIRENMGNVPVTAGSYILRWNPRRVVIEDALLKLAKGERPFELTELSRTHERVEDSAGGSWLMPRLRRRKERVIPHV